MYSQRVLEAYGGLLTYGLDMTQYMLRLAYLVVAALAISACQNEQVISRQSFVFGTIVEVKIRAADRVVANTAIDQLFARFDTLHSAWHAWKPGDMADVNAQLSTDSWFSPPPSVLSLLEMSKQLFTTSSGLFNPAIGELIALWGFHADELPDSPPEHAEIETFIEQLPNMDDVEIEGGRVRSQHSHLSIDAGGLAKGYAVDLGIKLLQKHGIENALVNAGGDLCGIGDRGDRKWRVGIRHPDKPGVLASINLQDGDCVFTSGDYERGYDYQGRHYHHIIDPRSGYPADKAVSVTVLHPDGALADAASTALLIAGPNDWQDVARNMGIENVLMVDHRGRLHMTAPMQARIRIEDDQTREIIVTPSS